MLFFLTVVSHRNHSHDVLRRNAFGIAAGAATTATAVLLVLHAARAAASRAERFIAIGTRSVRLAGLPAKLTIAHQLDDEDWTSEQRSSSTEEKEGGKEENLKPAENEVDPRHHIEVCEGDLFCVAIDEDSPDYHPRKLDRQQEDVHDTQKRRVGNAMSSEKRSE